MSPNDYPDSHHGWSELIAGMRLITRRHPQGHDCRLCREVCNERQPAVPKPPSPPKPPCGNCWTRPARSRQPDAECAPCQKYRHRTGVPRPQHLYSKDR